MDFDDGDVKEEHEIGRQVECMKGTLETSVFNERWSSYKMDEQVNAEVSNWEYGQSHDGSNWRNIDLRLD